MKKKMTSADSDAARTGYEQADESLEFLKKKAEEGLKDAGNELPKGDV